jgi:hypothetical protein
VARLNLERLHEITEKYDEKFLYALLSEEGVNIDTKPYDEGLVELLLEFPDEMDKTRPWRNRNTCRRCG